MSDRNNFEWMIEEYNRTHDDRHVPNTYRPWECDSQFCRGCIEDTIRAETKAEIDVLKTELAEMKQKLEQIAYEAIAGCRLG